MTADLAAMRRQYAARGLLEEDVLADPLAQFERWFEDARRAEIFEPNAMTLATVGEGGQPAARVVLLKGLDRRGLAFFTNFDSRKAREIAANGKGAVVFWWGPLARQVRFEGSIERAADAEADAYFASRPRGSRIGAWASAQSRPLESRLALEKRVAEYTARFHVGEIPRPPYWSGFRVTPIEIEFWRSGQFRLHDRLVYRRPAVDAPWTTERLYP